MIEVEHDLICRIHGQCRIIRHYQTDVSMVAFTNNLKGAFRRRVLRAIFLAHSFFCALPPADRFAFPPFFLFLVG